jgi:hypothetical protein
VLTYCIAAKTKSKTRRSAQIICHSAESMVSHEYMIGKAFIVCGYAGNRYICRAWKLDYAWNTSYGLERPGLKIKSCHSAAQIAQIR